MVQLYQRLKPRRRWNILQAILAAEGQTAFAGPSGALQSLEQRSALLLTLTSGHTDVERGELFGTIHRGKRGSMSSSVGLLNQLTSGAAGATDILLKSVDASLLSDIVQPVFDTMADDAKQATGWTSHPIPSHPILTQTNPTQPTQPIPNHLIPSHLIPS